MTSYTCFFLSVDIIQMEHMETWNTWQLTTDTHLYPPHTWIHPHIYICLHLVTMIGNGQMSIGHGCMYVLANELRTHGPIFITPSIMPTHSLNLIFVFSWSVSFHFFKISCSNHEIWRNALWISSQVDIMYFIKLLQTVKMEIEINLQIIYV